MTEQLLNQILMELKSLNNRFDKLESRFDNLEGRFDKLESRFGNLESRFDKLEGRFGNLEGRFDKLESRFGNLEGRFDKLEGRFDNLESRFDSLESRFDNLEGQVKENNLLIGALMHRTEELNAKFDGLLVNVVTKENLARLEAKMATKDDIDRLAQDVNFLVRKAAEHDNDIRQMRRVAL